MKSVILLGIKHCGKSSQSVLLGKKLDLDTYDTDQVIVDMTGKSAREIYTESGEEAFKAAEAAACTFVSDKIAGCGRSAVIATGGGICMNPAALQILRPLGTFVFLCAKEDIASERIVREIKIDAEGNLCNLPAYIAKRNPRSEKDVRDIFHEFYIDRDRMYSGISDIKVIMDNAPKAVNADRIIAALQKLEARVN